MQNTPADICMVDDALVIEHLARALQAAAQEAVQAPVALVTMALERPGGAVTGPDMTVRTQIDRCTRSLVFLQGDVLSDSKIALTATAVYRIIVADGG